MRHNSLDWLKWAAIVSMVVDHLRYVPPLENLGLFILGRPAFPIFAILCGWNLVQYSSEPLKFAFRVGTLAILLGLMQTFSAQGFWPLNPIFNLTLGILISLPLAQRRSSSPLMLCTAFGLAVLLAVLTLTYPIGPVLAYNWAGVGLVLAGSLSARTHKSHSFTWQYLSWLLVGALAWLVNGPVVEVNMIALCSALLTLWLLIRNPLPACPLPNNYWLYASFPLSLVPAIAWHWLHKGP